VIKSRLLTITFTTAAFDRSSLWLFEASPYRTAPKGPPSSFVQHDAFAWISQNAGLTPFAFYNPFDVAAGQQIGSNYDPTGNSTQGRVTVVFRGNWAQATDVARTNVQGLELVEVL
jgi:hypothetical protein